MTRATALALLLMGSPARAPADGGWFRQTLSERPRGDLRGADLREVRGKPWLDFRAVDLSGANFQSAWIPQGRFENANAPGTNWRGARLIGADFRGANLKDADFRGADLTAADFSGADLSQAKFEGALLLGARFCGAPVELAMAERHLAMVREKCP